jgi:hypothetical protein
VRPTPKIEVSPTQTCLFIGMLMPAIRAIFVSPLKREEKRGNL